MFTVKQLVNGSGWLVGEQFYNAVNEQCFSMWARFSTEDEAVQYCNHLNRQEKTQ